MSELFIDDLLIFVGYMLLFLGPLGVAAFIADLRDRK